jgi:hypothetical protein
MEKDILDGKLGQLGSYDLEFKGGKLVFKLEAAHAPVGVSGGFFVQVGAKAVFEALKRAIPGQIDDAILDGALNLLEAK